MAALSAVRVQVVLTFRHLSCIWKNYCNYSELFINHQGLALGRNPQWSHKMKKLSNVRHWIQPQWNFSNLDHLYSSLGIGFNLFWLLCILTTIFTVTVYWIIKHLYILSYQIRHVIEYPTMYYFGDPRHTQSLTAFMIFTEYSWEFQWKLHCGNVVNMPNGFH